jgi:hypothetical protein
MTKTLLELGASSAQADSKQTTALHYISGKQPELLETLFQVDEPAAKRAINHLSVSGSSWNPAAESPLMSAISKGNSLAALMLLESDAAPSINFESWMKCVETQYDSIASRNAETNHDDFERNTEQPIILAVQHELPDVALKLLDLGVDPNCLPKATKYDLKRDSFYRYRELESLLDIVRSRINSLKNYEEERRKPKMPDLKLEEGVDYLAGIDEGSYASFVAKTQIGRAKKSDEEEMKEYEEKVQWYNEPPRGGVAEKKEALHAMAQEFEKLEEILVGKGAKTFKELYQDKVHKEEQHNPNYRSRHTSEPEPWKIDLSFSVHDLTDETRHGFAKL